MNKEFGREFTKLQRFVPTRFLSPWCSKDLVNVPDHQKDKLISTLAGQKYEQKQGVPLYKFTAHPGTIGIEIHPGWLQYIYENWQIVRGFVLWSLVEYLQKRNPNVPNIPEKLFQPQERDLGEAKKYWNRVLKQDSIFSCIYSDEPIVPQSYSIDHFIPWSFACHDLLWNLVPAPKYVNSKKSDKLPSMSHYLDKFIQTQYQSLQVFLKNAPPNREKCLEDYTNLFQCDFNTLKSMSPATFKEKLSNTLIPLNQMASNIGFETSWVYSSP